MVREVAISIYLFVFRLFFNVFKLFPQKKTSTFVASFGDNILFTIKELEKQTDNDIVVLETAPCKVSFYDVPNRTVLRFETRNLLQWIKSIYHLATSEKIFVDNYYGFLAVTNFRPGTTCIQLWHAAGAIKQFGLMDLTIENRPQKAFKRFNKVYQRFDHVVVGSDNMATIFEEGFGLSKDQFLRTGVPRTDFFFDEIEKKHVKHLLETDFPILKEKKVILYAPTYRDDELDTAALHLDIDKMYDQLKYDYILLLKLHPAVNGTFENKHPGFVFNVSSYPNINHLLVVSDMLVSDYSSIPFEYSLLNKPMIFYAYDLDEYANSRGFWENYEKLVPGPIVETTDDLIQVIRDNNFDLNEVKQFAEEWNEYSTGNASAQLIRKLYGTAQEDVEMIPKVKESQV